MAVHAHPDDESSKGAATIARYVAEGVEVMVVTCTGGERGDILNPAMERPDVREHLAEVRRAELDASVDAIGYDRLDLLGGHITLLTQKLHDIIIIRSHNRSPRNMTGPLTSVSPTALTYLVKVGTAAFNADARKLERDGRERANHPDRAGGCIG